MWNPLARTMALRRSLKDLTSLLRSAVGSSCSVGLVSSETYMHSGLPKLSRTLPGTEFLAAIMAASAAFPASAAVYYMRVLRMISSCISLSMRTKKSL